MDKNFNIDKPKYYWKYFILRALRYFIRKLLYLPLDIYEKNIKYRHQKIPSRTQYFIGGDFIKQGMDFFGSIKKFTPICPGSTVLDIGCGIGRLAFQLKDYLSEEGQYFGFDINKSGIDWCRSNITEGMSNFEVRCIDLYNIEYNPGGKLSPLTFKFPYEKNKFDVVFATSVFSHMQENALLNYLSEINRVLRPSGIFLATMYIYDPDQKEDESIVERKFWYSFPNYRISDKYNPEYRIAYDIDFLSDHIVKLNFSSVSWKKGRWRKSPESGIFQDILILKK